MMTGPQRAMVYLERSIAYSLKGLWLSVMVVVSSTCMLGRISKQLRNAVS